MGRTEARQVPDIVVDSGGGHGGVGGRFGITRWFGFGRDGDSGRSDSSLPVEAVRARLGGGSRR